MPVTFSRHAGTLPPVRCGGVTIDLGHLHAYLGSGAQPGGRVPVYFCRLDNSQRFGLRDLLPVAGLGLALRS